MRSFRLPRPLFAASLGLGSLRHCAQLSAGRRIPVPPPPQTAPVARAQNVQVPVGASNTAASRAGPALHPLSRVPPRSRGEEQVLLAKSQYAIFTLGWCPTRRVFAVYAAVTNEMATMTESTLWKASAWMDERIGDTHIAGLLFASDSSTDVKHATSILKEKASRRLVVAPDTWGIAYLAFRTQQETIKAIDMPTSLEHASFLMGTKPYDASVLHPAITNLVTGELLLEDGVGNAVGAERDALLNWDVLYNVHKRFGTVGSRKVFDPIHQIVRRVVKAVNVFVVDINTRVGKGTISEGYTMIVTIYDAQKRSQSVHTLRSLSEETVKLNTLTMLLYGEGSASITLLVPTSSTKASQLAAFARTCKPKCPFFVIEVRSLAPYFAGVAITEGLTDDLDPRGVWARLRSNCLPAATRKEEEKMEQHLQRGFAGLANKLFSERISRVAPSVMSAVNSVPTPENPKEAHQRVSTAAEELRKQPVQSISSSTFLNVVQLNDAEVVFGLQQWREIIYNSDERLKRESESLNGIRRYLVIDLETTTKRQYKRIANPFTRDNYVVMSGGLDYQGRVFMPTRFFDKSVAIKYDDPTVTEATQLVPESSAHSLFLPCLDDYDVLVGHNIKFDLLHIWRDAELRRFLKRGGKIWDTMYAEYLLTGHQVRLGRGAGLEEVSKSYGWQSPKLDEVKLAWASGKETYQIPYSTLRAYLTGDLESTEHVFKKHMERALEQRQVIIINARMDGLLCTTEMEYNGLKTNVELATAQSNALVAKAAELKRKLEAAIPPEIPPDCHKFFNWASNMHLIAYFFGGRLKLATSAWESKTLPGEAFDRHTLFADPATYTKEKFPKGVFLRPPVYPVGAAECAIVSGCKLDKGVKFFKTYLDAYAKNVAFRKNTSLVDSLKTEVIAVSRSNPDERSSPEPLANLLPRRHIFFFAAATATATGTLDKLFIKNAITSESLTISVDTPDKAAVLKQFLISQVVAHTDMLLPNPDDTDAVGSLSAFLDAQVTIIARDAAFTFSSLIQTDEGIRSFFDAHTTPNDTIDPAHRFVINLADTVGALVFYRHLYGAETEAACRKSRGPPSDPTLIIPAKAMPFPAKTKVAAMQASLKKYRQEALMAVEDWCSMYIEIFSHMGNALLQRQALGDSAGPAGKGTAKGGKAAGKGTTKAKPKKKIEDNQSEEGLPVMLRRREVFVGYYNAQPAADRRRLALMALIGGTCSTPHDAFAVACGHEDTLEVSIRGRLSHYILNELDAEQVMRKFRSQATRQLQVGEDTLNYFVKTHSDQAAKTILELRQMEKLIGTYYEHSDGGTGMVSLVHSVDSCIHHELIHNKTHTGRLASANPNCQNIPKEDKSPLREMFVSRFGDQGMCVEADYSQLEVVALAVLANDKQMLDDLRNNVDFHCKRVTMMRPDLKYADVVLRAKKNKEPEFVKLRQQAKIFSFQRQYGAGVRMISHSTGLTQDQVRMLIKKEAETYRGVDIFNSVVTLSANNYDASLQDGARNVRGHQCFKGMFPVLTGSRYIFTESDLPEDLLRNRPISVKSTNFSPTHLKNYPVQGFAGEVVQIMLGVLWRHFLATDNYSNQAYLTNTVHDCVWVDCTRAICKDVAKDTEMIMSSVRKILNEKFPEMDISVEFPCDVVAGENMGALRPIEHVVTL